MSTSSPFRRGSIFGIPFNRTSKRLTLVTVSAVAVFGWAKAVLAATAGLPVTEDFADETLNDVAQTTADWNDTGVAATSNLRLHSSFSLVGTFDALTVGSDIGNQTNSTRGLAIGDLNHDGLVDLLAVGSGRNQVYHNSGNADPFDSGGFNFLDDANSTRSAAIADLNHDGFNDVVFVNSGANSPNIIAFSNGPGQSHTEVTLSTESTQSIRAADADGDGDIDLLAGNLNQTDRYFENLGLGVFFMHNIAIPPTANDDTAAVAFGDMDGDGLPDAIISTPSGQNWLYINNGTNDPFDSNTVVPTAISADTNSLDGSDGIAVGDLNGDGALDLVVGNAGVGTDLNRIYFNANTGPGTDPFLGVAGVNLSGDSQVTTSISIGDVDNDGDLDVLTGNIFGATGPRPGVNTLYLNDGAGTFAPGVAVSAAENTTRGVGLADFDGDGNLDVVAVNDGSENRFYANAGTTGGGSFQQLHAFAASIEVALPGDSVEIGRAVATTTSVGPATSNEIDYWLSNDGGASWIRTIPDGRPMDLGATTSSMMWRASLRSSSPSTAAALALNTLVVSTGNAAPVAGSVPANGGSGATAQGSAYTSADLRTYFSDADLDPLYVTIDGLPEGTGLMMNPQTGILSGTPTNEDYLAAIASECPIPRLLLTATATDGADSDSDSFRLRIDNQNDDPVLVSAIGPQTADVGGPVGIDVSANFSDPDTPDPDTCGVSTPLSFAAAGLPGGTGITLDSNTGVFGGSANSTDFGASPISVTVTATDGGGLQVQDVFQLTITDLENPPVVQTPIPDQAGTEGTPFGPVDISGSFFDGDGDPMTYSASGFPAGSGLSMDAAGIISGTPTNADAAASPFDVTVTATATSGDPGPAVDTFQFTVTDVANPPVVAVAIGAQAGTQDAAFNLNVTGNIIDGDGDALTFTATGLPASLTISTDGVISGTPTNDDALLSTFSVEVTAMAVDGSASDTFELTIANVNDDPVVTNPGNQSAMQGQAFNLDVSGNASDVDGDAMTFSASGLPAGTGLSISTDGIISGTPNAADAAASPISVTVTVSDGNGGEGSAQFQVTVTGTGGGGGGGGGVNVGGGGGGSTDLFSLLMLLGLAGLTQRRRTATRKT